MAIDPTVIDDAGDSRGVAGSGNVGLHARQAVCHRREGFITVLTHRGAQRHWHGEGEVIVPGVRIGNGAVGGRNSVVTQAMKLFVGLHSIHQFATKVQ